MQKRKSLLKRIVSAGAAVFIAAALLQGCISAPGSGRAETSERAAVTEETLSEELSSEELISEDPGEGSAGTSVKTAEESGSEETECSSEPDTSFVETGEKSENTSSEAAEPSSAETSYQAEMEPSAPVTDPGIVRTDTTLYTYEMMAADLTTIRSRYPEHLTVNSGGTTADGRTLYRVGFGNPSAPRSFLIVAATHGREYMTAQLVMKQIEYYAANYDTGTYGDRPFSELFEENYFVVVPMVNPDGVSVSELGEAGLRDETLRANLRTIYERDRAQGFTSESYERYLVRWKANARGVDLNRNFSTGWETVKERSEPSSDFFKGSAPGSEQETIALMEIVRSLPNLTAVISYHSYGDLVYWQYGQKEPLWTANRVLAEHIRNHAGHYLAGYSNEAGFTNWCIREMGIRAVVVETGRVPTPLPLSEFPDLWQRHRLTWAMLAAVVE